MATQQEKAAARAAQLGNRASASLQATAAGAPQPQLTPQSVYNQIASGQLIPNTNPNNTAWQSIPMDVRQQAYGMWDNAIKSGQVTFNELGIPSTLGKAGEVPTPTTPINASKLNPNQGYIDLKNVLGASINGDNLLDGIDSQTAGLFALLGQQSEADKAVEGFQAELLKSMDQLGGQASDLQAAYEAGGVNAAYDQVKQLSLRAAQLQGELQKFDVETLQGNENLGNKPIAQEFVTGQQAQYNRQRSLDKMARVAELSATVSLTQAYQGNAELAMQLAEKSVDLKYAPILNKINTLKTQLGFATEKATKADQKRAGIITALLGERQRVLSEQRAQDMKIQEIAIQAATNGAPLALVNQIKSAPTAIEASLIGAEYVRGNLEKLPSAGRGGGGRRRASAAGSDSGSALQDLLTQVQGFGSRESALSEVEQYRNEIVAQVGEEGLAAVLGEINRVYPETSPAQAGGGRLDDAGRFYSSLPQQAVNFGKQVYRTGEAMVKTVYNSLFGK